MINETYLNPVYDRPCPDPFVLKHCGVYWAYCTDRWSDGRVFGVLRSPDLVHWEEVGGALEPLAGDYPMYWAPEVSYFNGLFYLYYSVGNETLMEIRVAVAERPAGPFVDQGRRLTGEDFAIDPHVFEDDDGARYLFYATDFLDHSHVGTGTVCDRLIDPTTLAGDPRPVTRPRYDWQVYDPQRQEKGGVRWHTIEGSFTLKRKGRYYQMFSGGNWQNISYGVGYAVTDDPGSREEWRQSADGERVFPILRTIPGAVIGPGHNSVVRGPDNRQLFCVYHRWREDGSGRAMAIDRLDWAGERMLILGPSTEPQPAPNRPALSGFGPDWRWERGRWQSSPDEARCAETSQARASLALPGPDLVVELSLNIEIDPDLQGWAGLAVEAAGGATLLRWRLDADMRSITIEWADTDSMVHLNAALPQPLRRGAYQLLRLELNGKTASLTLNERTHVWHGELSAQPASLALEARDLAAAWAGFSLTQGWQDEFSDGRLTPEQLGWSVVQGRASLEISDQELRCRPGGDQPAVLAKASGYANVEAVVNLRLLGPAAAGGYGFRLSTEAGPALTLTLASAGAGWALRAAEDRAEYQLPEAFDPEQTQQFRLRLEAGQLALWCETHLLGRLPLPVPAGSLALVVPPAGIALDMVRVTALGGA